MSRFAGCGMSIRECLYSKDSTCDEPSATGDCTPSDDKRVVVLCSCFTEVIGLDEMSRTVATCNSQKFQRFAVGSKAGLVSGDFLGF